MAEFDQVIKQIKRMCEAHCCEDCPIREEMNNAPNCPFCAESINWAVIEAEVAFWTDKHPEPRYPTWREWLKLHLDSQITPDVAEKLGIKPIGVKDDA